MTAGAYIDRIEILYPQDWIALQSPEATYPLDRYLNVYHYPEREYQAHEEDEFMIPLGIKHEGDVHTILV